MVFQTHMSTIFIPICKHSYSINTHIKYQYICMCVVCVFMYIHAHILMHVCLLHVYICICHKGVVFQTIRSIVHAQGASLQCISNQMKANDEAFF